MAHEISVVGLMILDILGRPVHAIPQGGNVDFIDEIRLTAAGTAGGMVVISAKLGLDCLAVGAVGNDEKGEFVLDVYKRHGIDISAMQRIDGIPTSATILPVRPNGDRPALHNRGASDHLWVDEADFDTVCDCRILHMGGTGLLDKMDGGQSAKLLSHAKSKGVTTTFDLIAPNQNTIELLKPILPHVDYFMPSMEEAEFISGKAGPADIAKVFHDLGATTCIFKWGAKGSYISGPDGTFRVPAFKIEVTDTTGCGDAYCAGFVTGMAQGFDLEKSCRLGTAASAFVATGLGSDAGVTDFQTTLAFMNSAQTLEN